MSQHEAATEPEFLQSVLKLLPCVLLWVVVPQWQPCHPHMWLLPAHTVMIPAVTSQAILNALNVTVRAAISCPSRSLY